MQDCNHQRKMFSVVPKFLKIACFNFFLYFLDVSQLTGAIFKLKKFTFKLSIIPLQDRHTLLMICIVKTKHDFYIFLRLEKCCFKNLYYKGRQARMGLILIKEREKNLYQTLGSGLFLLYNQAGKFT